MLFKLHQDPRVRPYLNAVDYYAGQGLVAERFQRFGMHSRKIEVDLDQINHDAIGSEGFVHMVILAMALLPYGLAHFGTVCSSWVFMCRDSSGRSHEYPLGYQQLPWVRAGNIMSCRMVLLLMLITVRGCHYILE